MGWMGWMAFWGGRGFMLGEWCSAVLFFLFFFLLGLECSSWDVGSGGAMHVLT